MTIDPMLAQPRSWNGHQIVRTYYAGRISGTPPPGIPKVPSEGEYFVSPDLEVLVKSDPVVAALFKGQRFQGLISDSGLTQPHELRAIAGISSQEWTLVPVIGFGRDQASDRRNKTLDRAVFVLVVAMVWTPAAALIVLVTRLSASRRRQRARSLRLLGLSARIVRAVNVLEVALVVVPSAFVGTAVYRLWVHHVTKVPWMEWGYFPDDADPGFLVAVLVVSIVTVAAAISAAVLIKEPKSAGVGNVSPASSRVSKVGLKMLVGALAYLACMNALVIILHDGAVIGMWIADALVAVGLALAAPRLVGTTFALLLRRVRAGGALVGLRLQVAGSSTSLRLGGLLAVVIVLLLGSLSFMNVLQNGGQGNWSATLAGQSHIPVTVNDISGTLVLPAVSDLEPVGGAIQIVEVSRKGSPLPVVLADCSALGVLAGSPPRDCQGKPQWISVRGAATEAVHPKGSVKVPGVGSVAVPPASATTELSQTMPDSFHGALLLPARYAAAESTRHSSRFLLLATSDRLSVTLASLSGESPSAQFDLGPLDRRDPDNKAFPAQLSWIVLGAGLSLGLGALALSIVVAAEVQERSRKFRGLRVLGAPRSQVILAHFWSTAAPVILLGWAGVFAGCLACLAMYAFDDRAHVEFGVAGWIGALVLVVGLALAVATVRDVLRGVSQSGSLKV